MACAPRVSETNDHPSLVIGGACVLQKTGPSYDEPESDHRLDSQNPNWTAKHGQVSGNDNADLPRECVASPGFPRNFTGYGSKAI